MLGGRVAFWHREPRRLIRSAGHALGPKPHAIEVPLENSSHLVRALSGAVPVGDEETNGRASRQ
jgi:hypothetical protein